MTARGARRRRWREIEYVDRNCSGRARFETEREAQESATKKGLRAYPCLDCEGWHLTGRRNVLF